MTQRDITPRLFDIVQAIEHIRSATAGLSLEAFEGSWEKRWVIERGIEIISEASRHLSEDLKARHPEIPWSKVAGIGNILRHDYESVSAPAIWSVVQDHLPALEKACRAEMDGTQ